MEEVAKHEYHSKNLSCINHHYAINWGLIGFFQFDLVAAIFGGQGSALSRIIYGLVGIAGLINLGLLFKPNEERSREEAANPEMR